MSIHLAESALKSTTHEVPEHLRKLIDEPVNTDLIDKNKYANNSEFVSESIYKRILNKITNYQWSFVPYSVEIKDDGGNKFVEYIGLLIAPGYGIHTGIGTQPMNKKGNQNATAAAKTYAFKNACKEMGLAPNVGDDNFDEMLFETDVEDFVKSKKKEIDKTKKKKKPNPKPADKPAGKKPKIKDRIEEIRDAYDIESDDDLVAFLQIWDVDILELEDVDDEDWTEFFKYFDKNKKEFEDF